MFVPVVVTELKLTSAAVVTSWFMGYSSLSPLPVFNVAALDEPTSVDASMYVYKSLVIVW